MPRRRLLDSVRDDIREKGLSGKDVYDRASLRRISSIDSTKQWDLSRPQVTFACSSSSWHRVSVLRHFAAFSDN